MFNSIDWCIHVCLITSTATLCKYYQPNIPLTKFETEVEDLS